MIEIECTVEAVIIHADDVVRQCGYSDDFVTVCVSGGWVGMDGWFGCMLSR